MAASRSLNLKGVQRFNVICISIKRTFILLALAMLPMCGQSTRSLADEIEQKIPRAIVIDEEAIEDVEAEPEPTPKELALKLLESSPYDIESIGKAFHDRLLSLKEIRKAIPDGYFASQVGVESSNLLPFEHARIDVFMQGSLIHQIKQEFLILSIDGEIRAIGRVSTGAGRKSTPARRWEIYGVDKNRKSKSYGDAPMPYAIMLSNFGQKFYSEVAFHGSLKRYDFNYPDSKGCIRQFTESFVKEGTNDAQAKWPRWGLHRILWNLLVPNGIQSADHVESFLYGSWYRESDLQLSQIRELRYKTVIWTHRASSLKQVEGWKEALENLYPKDLISETLVRKANGSRGYAEFESGDGVAQLDLDAFKAVYEIERTRYKRPAYLASENETEDEHYDRRHLIWMK
jgi:hypothetical protein